MKLRKIVEVFSAPQGQEGVLVRVFRSIKDFARKVSLNPAYKELQEIVTLYENDRKDIYNSLVREYCDEVNKKREKEQGEKYEKLIPEDVKGIPTAYINKLNAKLDDMLDKDIQIKKKLKFTAKEIKSSGIDGHDIFLMEDFYDMKEMEALAKEGEKKKDKEDE